MTDRGAQIVMRQKKAGLAVVLVSLLLALAGCGGTVQQAQKSASQSEAGSGGAAPAQSPAQAPAKAKEKIRLGLPVANVNPELFPAYVGAEKGFWSKRGLDVEVITFGGGGKLQQAILAGSVDVAVDSAVGAATAIAKGSTSKVVAEIGSRLDLMVLVVPKGSPITDMAGLKGAKIGVTSHGSTTDWLAQQVAKLQGWDPDKGVTRVPLGGFNELLAGIKTKNVDAIVVSSGGALALEEAGQGKILFSFGPLIPNYQNMMMRIGKGTKFVAQREYEIAIGSMSGDGVASLEGLKNVAASLVDIGAVDKAPAPSVFFTDRFVPFSK